MVPLAVDRDGFERDHGMAVGRSNGATGLAGDVGGRERLHALGLPFGVGGA